jgi:class 3 adenylate cyclase
MAATPIKRKLAAILAADAVSYSRLMAADEEGTMKILSAHRAVIDGIIEFHEGRIINTAGDSVLAEFASPTDAVRCAVEVQDALKTRNDSLAEERRLHFRIGVNLGDVMVKGDDLLGDGVNVAARLEGIAEPGNIYISSSVYDQIAGKLDLGFVDMGDQSLKNIDRPIRAYRVDREGRRATVAARTPRRGAGHWIAATLGAVAVAGGIAWYLVQASSARQEAQAQAKVAAESARVRAESEEAKRKAVADAEVAKARAEADEAKRRAESATASALQARHELDEQRTADARSRAQAELAQAHADADATRRKADAELAAATQSRRAAEAAAKAATAAPVKAVANAAPVVARAGRYQGPWMAVFDCPEFRTMPATSIKVPLAVSGDAFELQHRLRDQPGSFNMRGVPNPDGRLQLTGGGYSGFKNTYGRPYPVAFDGRFAGEHYEGSGNLGTRECGLTITRSAVQSTPTTHQGQWAASFSCAAFEGEAARTFTAMVTIAGETFELQSGKRDQPGWLQMNGVPQADGRLQLSGNGLSRHEKYRGKPYAAVFDGKLAGERYEGNGRLGKRDCALVMARK